MCLQKSPGCANWVVRGAVLLLLSGFFFVISGCSVYYLILTLQAAGAGGPNPGTAGVVSPTTRAITPGTPVSVSATPSSGYRFVNWTVAAGTGALFGDANSPATTVTPTIGDVTVQGNFVYQYTLTINVDIVTNGTTTPSGAVVVDWGAATTITATALSGYSFSLLDRDNGKRFLRQCLLSHDDRDAHKRRCNNTGKLHLRLS